MKPYIVHDASGNILRTGICAPGDVELQAQAGEFVVEGVAHDERHRIVVGKVVDLPAHELAARAAKRIHNDGRPRPPALQEQIDAILAGGADLEQLRAHRLASKGK